ncbi:hypothetical protein DPMN_081408 [Dreissena polymorpha]|uniref:Uncharacterized protein n=1 Tax=Dreissena polymorpha TaxID=45954 RepID=A0A9D4BGH2_DREPO|nr:hypothetical protein DPMN_081408 [Dreissena polymorpha]
MFDKRTGRKSSKHGTISKWKEHLKGLSLEQMTNAPPPGGHVFQATGTIFELVRDIIKTNLLTKFRDDRTINVASRVLTRNNATTAWRPLDNLYPCKDKATETIFELVQDIIGTHILTKFYEDRKINVTSRVLTRKNAPPPGGHVFQQTGIIFELVHNIIGMNLLTKFHEDRTINVASRVKNVPPLGSHTNLLTKIHEDWTINVASRVFTRKNAPPLGSHVFQANTNLLIKCHEDWAINVASNVLTRKTAQPPGGHVFSPILTIFKLVRDINITNVLTKFHDDWAKNDDWAKIVTSRVFTRNNAPPSGGHLHEDLASNVTSTVFTTFELSRGINGTNVLTKYHDDKTIYVASRVFTRQNVDDARRTTEKRRS